MTTPPLRIDRKQVTGAKIAWSIGVVFWVALGVYWGTQVVLGVPDAYPGQHRGGLMLSVASLMLCVGSLVSSLRWRLALFIAMWVPLAAAIYFLIVR